MNLNKFQISESASLRDALLAIEKNTLGIICIASFEGIILGVATDGDIRRNLLKGKKLSDSIKSTMNKNFFWEKVSTPREKILKSLDTNIRAIPILNENKILVNLVSRDHLPLESEEPVIVRSISPVRISFAGGGSDVTNYFGNNQGAALNATISLYSHVLLKKRNDNKITVNSLDLNEKLSAVSLNKFLQVKGQFSLIQAILKMIKPDFGFDIEIHSDFPIKSGLGGSAAVSAAIIGCFSQLRTDQWNPHEIAELSFQAERLHLGISGGWQDQYATVFGGLNFIEFNKDKNIVHPLRLSNEIKSELEESLVLCDTKISHNSGDIHNDQKYNSQKPKILEKVKSNVEIAYIMRDKILRGRFNEFGQLLNETWQNKKSLSSKISSNYLDKIYEGATKNGAIGGKLLGAGGGGCFLFYVPPFKRLNLVNYLKSIGLSTQPFNFENSGLRSWKTRQS